MNNTAEILKSDKFKTAIISLAIRTRPDYIDASKNALLSKMFSVSSSVYKTKYDIVKKLDEMNGSVFDVYVIKKGYEHIILFFMEVLCTEESDLKEPLEFIKDIVYKPFVCDNKFDLDTFKREKNRLLNEIKAKRDRLGEYVIDKCVENMYDKKGFGIDTIGDIEAVNSITPSNLFEYYESIMKNSPFTFIICGNVNEDSVKNYLRENFTDVLYRGFNIEDSKEKFRDKPKECFENANIKQGKLCIGFKTGITLLENDIIPLMLFNEILGGNPNSRLFLNVREKEGLCYYVNSYIYKFKGVILVQAGIDKSSYDKTLDIIKSTVEEMKENISDDELEYEKKSLIQSFNDMYDISSSLCDNILNNIVVDRKRSIKDYIDLIEKFDKKSVMKISEKLKLDTIYFLSAKEEGENA